MALTKDDLQAIQEILAPQFDSINNRLDGMDNRLDGMDNRLDGIDDRLNTMQADIETLKENVEIVMDSTNTLIAWVDEASIITQITFPVKKAQK